MSYRSSGLTAKSSTLVVALSVALWLPAGLSAQQPDLAALQRRIQQTVREAGVVESAAAVEIRNEVPGQTAILWVVEEGTQVREGDELVRLDSSALENQITEQRVKVSKARVEVQTAKATVESLNLRRETARQTLAVQKQAAKLARAALLGDGGEIQQKVEETISEIKVSEARVAAVAGQVKKWQAETGRKEPSGELRLARVEADERLAIAQRRLRFLEKVLRPSQEAQMELEQLRSAMELQTESLEIDRDLAVAESKLAAAEISLKQETDLADRLSNFLSRCVITAPQSGTVVYNNVRSSRGTTGSIIEPGAIVRERQTLLKLPDLSKLQVRTLVNETRIAQVRPGQTASIRVDALPEETFRGVVQRVSRTPEPATFLQNAKNYAVIVTLTEPTDVVRLGMTALVEIQTKPPR